MGGRYHDHGRRPCRLAIALVAGAGLALCVLGPASARTRAALEVRRHARRRRHRGDPDTLDPTLMRGALRRSRSPSPSASSSTTTTGRSRIVPQLAAALPVISKDKLTYTIPLRQGIVFNDGTPFNAQAVVTTLQRMITLPGSSTRERLRVRRQRHRVRAVHGRHPPEDAVHAADRDARHDRRRRDVADAARQARRRTSRRNPVCVGPFMFDHRVVGDNVTVIKSPYYYDQKDVHLDKIVFKPMPDAAGGGGGAQGGRHPGARPGLDDRAAGRPAGRRACGCSQTTRSRLAGHLINIGNRNGVGNLPYTNVGTPLASSAEAAAGVRGGDRPQRAEQGRLRRHHAGRLHARSRRRARLVRRDASAARRTTRRTRRSSSPQSGFPNPTVHLLAPTTTDNLRLAQFIQAQEAAVGINVVIDSADTATVTHSRRAGTSTRRCSGPASGADTDGNIFECVRDLGVEELRRLLEPAARPDPRQRAQGDDARRR